MRAPIENISRLQMRLNNLELENQILKNLLENAGISYQQEIVRLRSTEGLCDYDPNQGARIQAPDVITDKMAVMFYSRFWGRQDVYAKRNEKKGTGEAGYYTQCHNFWKEVCPKKRKQKINCRDCTHQAYMQLTKEDILAHLHGKAYNASDVVGVYPLLTNGTCRFLVYDFDNHEKGAEKKDFANEDDTWIEEVEAMRKICVLNGIDPLVERSRSGRGAHIWIFFDKPIPAALVRKFGTALLDRGAEQVNLKSFKYYDRMLPAQDMLPEDGVGNLIALPLQGKALLQGNSAFIDSNWNAYPNQWEILWSKPRLSKEFIETKMREWTSAIGDMEVTEGDEEREKPWEKNRRFQASEVDGKISITLSNGIYVDSTNLKPALQNKIRRMAVISNPIYYNNQAIGTSNYDTSRWIYLGQDHLGGYIEIPRGLYSALIENIEQAKIPYKIEDERQTGRNIGVDFKGELREEQKPALNEMLKFDNGILHAATAFGKTVVCSAIIAEKKVNTLIILESSSLIEQWQGSLCKKGEFHNLLNQYGMIIVDECHHAASDTISNVLKEAKAKYVYGVTATPKRGDGLEKINYMLLGPIRYSYTAKEKAKSQGIAHLVYPRFTRVVAPRGVITEKMHPNEAYDIIHNNDMRDEQILRDIKECVSAGRTPVVLSRYKDHSEKLYERTKGYADHVFLMTGNNSKREHKKILEQLHQVDAKESVILIATGSLIGEGFDFPRLDTLFMAMPVSFQSIVEQYAGRLNRDYEGKENVIVYDYVDSHIPMFDNMYAKRLKAYKQIGYEVCGGLRNEKRTANAIFDSENYFEVYRKDLLEANKNIVISSPTISGPKVYELIHLLRDKQALGVEITIVSWKPDSYGFGDAGFWMQLHEEIRQAGFYMKTVEDTCEHFAIIDQEIVWYGSMNLLAKTKIEDSMMRVQSKKIAAELMELTFGKES